MPEKSVEEILKQSAYNHSSNTYLFTCEDLRKAAQAIRDYYLEKVPKGIPIPSEPLPSLMAGELSGFNTAIAEMRKVVEEG